MNIIEWCNQNNGFLAGLLSVLTLITSIIAIIISINTARLPYKKKLFLSRNISFEVGTDISTNKKIMRLLCVHINASNVGNRNVNITFIGYAVKIPGQELQTMQSIQRELGGTGILKPTEMTSARFSAADLHGFNDLPPKTKVYYCVIDSEDTKHLKYCGELYALKNNIQKLIDQ